MAGAGAGLHFCFHLFIFLVSAHSFQFPVGGRDGWTLNPSEKYNHWAVRMRFQVNDTLLFKYKKDSDSVLQVEEEDYQKCNTKKPVKKMEHGDSVFKFPHSGPFFFISGEAANCYNGQKLIVVVMAIRPRHPLPHYAPAAAPAALAPAEEEGPAPAEEGDDGGTLQRSFGGLGSEWSASVVAVALGLSLAVFN